jgi:hypothetical protein
MPHISRQTSDMIKYQYNGKPESRLDIKEDKSVLSQSLDMRVTNHY